MTKSFAEVLQTRYTRRAHLKQLLMSGAVSVVATSGATSAIAAATAGTVPPATSPSPDTSSSGSSLTFQEIPHAYDGNHHVAPGYRADVLIRWGDAVTAGAPAFSAGHQSAADQAAQFGYNNDFLAFMPLPRGSENSDHGLLFVNHEHPAPHLMFPGYEDRPDAAERMNADELRVEQQALGLSIVEIKKENGRWQVVSGSRYARRITTDTPVAITGPAAGNPRLRAGPTRTGIPAQGTLGNCAGGFTPWGTVLTGEENIYEYFWGDREQAARMAPAELESWKSFGIGFSKDDRKNVDEGVVLKRPLAGWHRIDQRFDLEKEPHEPNRFGWIVEVDPYDPHSLPKKRTALGRFKHEGATVAARHGRSAAVYSGDDQEYQFIYRFVSRQPYDAMDQSRNLDLLEDGDLYAARFNDDGTGEWIKLNQDADTAGDVLIDARQVAKSLGATPMDRPEDIEISPQSDCLYVSLTMNPNRLAQLTDAANPVAQNHWGHIIEIKPPGHDGDRNHTAASFEWELLVLGGNPKNNSPNHASRFHAATSESGWFSNPDNLAFDPKGRLWVATDGMATSSAVAGGRGPVHDGLWAMDISGPGRALPKHFYGCPRGAEMCGPCFTPDGKTLFVAVQHPGDEKGSTYTHPSTRWPDFQPETPPRPSVVVITKTDGGEIGD